jgi:hypothetical protein
METGTAALQNFDPLKTFNLHLCGFAFYKDDPNRQVFIQWENEIKYFLWDIAILKSFFEGRIASLLLVY